MRRRQGEIQQIQHHPTGGIFGLRDIHRVEVNHEDGPGATAAGEEAEILDTAVRNGANGVRIFGSIARGGDHGDSDIDFLVEFDKGRSALDEVSLIEELEQLRGRKVHVVTLGALHRVIRDKVLAEARPL